MKKRFLLLLALLMLLAGCSKEAVIEEEEVIEELIEEIEEEEIAVEEDPFDYVFLNQLLETNREINKDYIGELWFESELVHESVVQGATNDTYLRKNWKTGEYESSGSIFVDFRNTLEDQNIIIYGHYVYLSKDPNGDRVFTPLRFLTEEENYEDNKTFYLLLDGEIRVYEIAVVYYCQLVNNNTEARTDMQYYFTNYDESYFETYKAAIQKAAFYDTGVDFGFNDKFVTLQTCVENRDDLREIILAKQVDVLSTIKE